MPTKRFDEALRTCLNRCRGPEPPLVCLAEFVGELREAGWSDFDCRVIEKAVIRLLGEVTDPAPDDAVICPNCHWPDPVVLLREPADTVYLCSDCQHQWPASRWAG